MKFMFTNSELSYLAKQLGYNKLLGFNQSFFSEQKVIDSLKEKKYIEEVSGSIKISNSIILLLSGWSKMNYSILRLDYRDKNNAYYTLASKELILLIADLENEISICMYDFSIDNMDSIIKTYLKIPEVSDCKDSYVVPIFDLNIKNLSNKEFARKTGLSIEQIEEIDGFCNDDTTGIQFIVQSISDDAGMMCTLFSNDNALFMFKDITAGEVNKMVIVKGNTQDIIDSIYIF